MSSHTVGCNQKGSHPFAGGLERAPGQAGLQYQNGPAIPGFLFDQGPCRRSAHFLVGVEQQGQRPFQSRPAARQKVGQSQHQGGAAAHVKGGRTKDLPLFQPGRAPPGLAHTPDRIQMAQQEQGFPLGFGTRKPGQQVVSPLRVGDQFHRGAVAAEPVAQAAGQPVQRRLVVRRRIRVDQVHQPLDHLGFQIAKIGEECRHGKNASSGRSRPAPWLARSRRPRLVSGRPQKRWGKRLKIKPTFIVYPPPLESMPAGTRRSENATPKYHSCLAVDGFFGSHRRYRNPMRRNPREDVLRLLHRSVVLDFKINLPERRCGSC